MSRSVPASWLGMGADLLAEEAFPCGAGCSRAGSMRGTRTLHERKDSEKRGSDGLGGHGRLGGGQKQDVLARHMVAKAHATEKSRSVASASAIHTLASCPHDALPVPGDEHILLLHTATYYACSGQPIPLGVPPHGQDRVQALTLPRDCTSPLPFLAYRPIGCFACCLL